MHTAEVRILHSEPIYPVSWAVAKLVRQLILNQLCPGSNPGRPSKDLCVLGCRQAGKAGDFESPIRWFESSHPIQADVVQRQECNHGGPERRVVLAGASPVRVSAEAPVSRLQLGGEI